MMNEPTKRAMTANTIRKMLKKLMSSLIAAWSSAVSSAPVSTSTSPVTVGLDAARQLGLADAVLAARPDAVDLPRLGEDALGGRRP